MKKNLFIILFATVVGFTATDIVAKTWFYNNTDFDAKIGIMPGISLKLENVNELETHLIETKNVKTLDDLKGWHVIALQSKSAEGAMLVYRVKFPDTQNVKVDIYPNSISVMAGLDEVKARLFTDEELVNMPGYAAFIKKFWAESE